MMFVNNFTQLIQTKCQKLVLKPVYSIIGIYASRSFRIQMTSTTRMRIWINVWEDAVQIIPAAGFGHAFSSSSILREQVCFPATMNTLALYH